MKPQPRKRQNSSFYPTQIYKGPSESRAQFRFPDEIVKEIFLYTPLKVVQEDFRSQDGERSPFFDSTHLSSSRILLVCKQWMRVATPLLYDTIVLRSKAQAQGLERALRDDGKQLGLFIRKVRLEGHYGLLIENVFDAAPNVMELCISLTVPDSERPSGLIKSLPKLHLSTLIFLQGHSAYSLSSGEGSRAFELLEALCQFIEDSSSLMYVYLPTGGCATPEFRAMRNDQLAQSLASTPNLKTVYMKEISSRSEEIYIISHNKSIEQIVIQNHALSFLGHLDERGRELLVYEGKTLAAWLVIWAHKRQLWESTLPKPASDVFEDAIWQRIIDFTMEAKAQSASFIRSRSTRDRLPHALLLTCKTFHRLGVHDLYKTPMLSTSRTLIFFARKIVDQPALAKHVESITLYTFERSFKEPKVVREAFTHLRLVAFGQSALYRRVDPPEVTWSTFHNMCRSSASTLLYLYPIRVLQMPNTGTSLISSFGCLRSLRRLSWHSKDPIDFETSQIQPSIFSTLEELDYEERVLEPGKTLLAMMAHMSLPSLRSIRFGLSYAALHTPDIDHMPDAALFLREHGTKIISLHYPSFVGMIAPFAYCPNITSLTVEKCPNKFKRASFQSFLRCSSHHLALEKISFKPFYWERVKGAEQAFEPSNYASFPSLREIQTMTCRWPTSEREIIATKNIWPKRSEKLRVANIVLTDEQGKHWTPRLQVYKGTKRRNAGRR